MDFFTTTTLFSAGNGSNCRAEAGRRAAAAEPQGSDTAARYRGRSLHPMRPFQVAVAARIGSQSICRVQRHRSAGRCQIISSRASAEEFRIRSFEPADRRPSRWRKPPPAPRHLLHWWISLIAGHWNAMCSLHLERLPASTPFSVRFFFRSSIIKWFYTASKSFFYLLFKPVAHWGPFPLLPDLILETLRLTACNLDIRYIRTS